MGFTGHSRDLVLPYVYKAKTICELGAQNIYFGGNPGRHNYASNWYATHGLDYDSIDSSGENKCIVKDLSKVHKWKKQYDIVTDFGTSEHVAKNFYHCWVNKWNLCKEGGVIVSENPMTGNWPGHGAHYVTEKFYTELAKLLGCETLAIGTHAAMHNTTDGWNVFCTLQKNGNKFITKEEFEKLDYRKV